MHYKVLTELIKLIKVINLYKISKKSTSALKWKMIEEVLERRKNHSRYVEEKDKILTL